MNTSKKKILVVDDSETNIVLLNGILEQEGFKVRTSLNALDGLDIVENDKPDLVLLDLKMPNMSGFTFLEKLYSKEYNKNIPVIVVTAFNEKTYIENSYHLGAKDVIIKPIEIDILVSKIKNAFEAYTKTYKV